MRVMQPQATTRVACPASGLWPDGGVADSLNEAKGGFPGRRGTRAA